MCKEGSCELTASGTAPLGASAGRQQLAITGPDVSSLLICDAGRAEHSLSSCKIHNYREVYISDLQLRGLLSRAEMLNHTSMMCPKCIKGICLLKGLDKLKPSLLVNNNSGTTTTQDSVCGTEKELSTGKHPPFYFLLKMTKSKREPFGRTFEGEPALPRQQQQMECPVGEKDMLCGVERKTIVQISERYYREIDPPGGNAGVRYHNVVFKILNTQTDSFYTTVHRNGVLFFPSSRGDVCRLSDITKCKFSPVWLNTLMGRNTEGLCLDLAPHSHTLEDAPKSLSHNVLRQAKLPHEVSRNSLTDLFFSLISLEAPGQCCPCTHTALDNIWNECIYLYDIIDFLGCGCAGQEFSRSPLEQLTAIVLMSGLEQAAKSVLCSADQLSVLFHSAASELFGAGIVLGIGTIRKKYPVSAVPFTAQHSCQEQAGCKALNSKVYRRQITSLFLVASSKGHCLVAAKEISLFSQHLEATVPKGSLPLSGKQGSHLLVPHSTVMLAAVTNYCFQIRRVTRNTEENRFKQISPILDR
ncbi:hypothetical protein Anapl_10561 [Anas platyrhynchos]|uniref:Uncharacterized protein n=1 Tax=Anas platyrhynchos TaxID=8839 RepID=R0JKG4_ANAPL|nr:hypothetical protein Anapl_10561 [Anas platyrhynchos]